MLEDHVTLLKPLLSGDQSELRAQENTNYQAIVEDGHLIKNFSQARSGVFARVFKGGVFGCASNSVYNEKTAKEVLENAHRLAIAADKRCRIGEGPIPKIENGKLELDRSLKSFDQSAHIDLAFQLDSYIAKKYPKLLHRNIRVRSQCTEKRLVVTNGWDAHTAIIRAYVDVELTAEGNDGVPVSYGNYFGKSCYLDEAFADTQWLYDCIDTLYLQLMDYAEGIYPEAGYHDIVLSPDLAGMLAHEAIGHTVEADGVLGGSISGLYLNRPVASEIVTLMDYANKVPGGDAPCHMLVDDEGTPCKDVTIIKNGILNSFMHSRQTARNMHGDACGNIRASQYYDEPMVRMRNTAIAPGKDTLEDMISSIDNGYYLVGNENGSGALNGEYVIVTSLGYEIKNGKLGRPIRGTSVSGQAFEMLKTVSMISNNQKWRFGGMCGKKQGIETATGGPAIKCKANMAGK